MNGIEVWLGRPRRVESHGTVISIHPFEPIVWRDPIRTESFGRIAIKRRSFGEGTDQCAISGRVPFV